MSVVPRTSSFPANSKLLTGPVSSPVKSNYLDLVGGGSLLLSYDPTNGATLRGRYTINDGQMKYSMPVIPLRTFTIKEGSYLEFSGDPMHPKLHITATEAVRTSVTITSGTSRIVDFNCGVKLRKQFPKPSVEFIIDAPDDQEMLTSSQRASIAPQYSWY